MSDPVREITVRISTGKVIRLVTNDLDAPAEEIADLYKQRWQIELFFKWIKQNLKIKHFLGTSENAVRIQLYVALIAYLLLRLAQAAQSAVKQPVTFAPASSGSTSCTEDQSTASTDPIPRSRQNPKILGRYDAEIV